VVQGVSVRLFHFDKGLKSGRTKRDEYGRSYGGLFAMVILSLSKSWFRLYE